MVCWRLCFEPHDIARQLDARRLQETSHSIAEIANAVGFSDQSYFDRQFERAFGCQSKNFHRGAARG